MQHTKLIQCVECESGWGNHVNVLMQDEVLARTPLSNAHSVPAAVQMHTHMLQHYTYRHKESKGGIQTRVKLMAQTPHSLSSPSVYCASALGAASSATRNRSACAEARMLPARLAVIVRREEGDRVVLLLHLLRSRATERGKSSATQAWVWVLGWN